jgi:c-di-GMP-binding flagellar brake protein YcgR
MSGRTSIARKCVGAFDHQNNKMSYFTKRKDTRYDFPLTIEYVLEAHTDDKEARKGITIDLSAAGLCMYVFDPLPQGQKITIKTVLPVDSRTAVICWTRNEKNSLYRSGLKFI